MGSLSAVARLALGVTSVSLHNLQHSTHRLCCGCPTQPWGLCAAQGVGTWGCVAAWDTHGQGSATCSLHCKGVAAGARDMLSPQDVLMCSDPCPSPLPSVPIPQACSFDLHPALFFFVWGCFFHQNLISTL